MTNLVERRAFNVMGIFDGLEEYLNTGDPEVREWFLVKSNFWPLFLCAAYLLIIKAVGPALMRDRKPFELRNTMILYNLFLVVAYLISTSMVVYGMFHTESGVLCRPTVVTKQNNTYMMATCGWVIYLLKYAEFFDTFFFVLRKKDKLITNLHVIHHASLPLVGWIFFRTERSGFQAYPIVINSFVHIVMYSYYGLAAVGPSVRKYLWWKRYLTIAQMIQFVLIFMFATVVMPLAGCTSAKTSVYINITCATLFFALFYNFYQQSFKPKSDTTTHASSSCYANGAKTNGATSNGTTANGATANGATANGFATNGAVNGHAKLKDN